MVPQLMFDPETDVVRAHFGGATEDCVAVTFRDLTLVVSSGQIVSIEIQDLPTFAEQYIAAEHLPPGLEGERLFRAASPHIDRLASLLAQNLGPLVKDRIRSWDEFVPKTSAIDQAP